MDRILEISSLLAAMLLLVFSVPRTRLREAVVVYLFMQALTWFLGLVVVEAGLIVYPVRLFPESTNTSFGFEFVIYPVICVIFNLHYPERKGWLRQFLHFALFCTAITVVEVIVERYTDIIEYTGWTWYWTWLSLFVTLFASRLFYLWFFHKKWEKPAR